MIEGVCRVCGSPLAVPLVTCPQCATPHHQDCWEYNGGCTIFGCTGTGHVVAALPVVSAPVPLPVAAPLPPLVPRLAGSAVVLAVIGKLFGGPLAVAAMGAIGWWLKDQLNPPPVELEEPVTLAGEDLTLETKEVARLIGSGEPEQLAQAYALFEQRHPRDVLHGEAQPRLAAELLAAGHLVLGVEALDKAAARQDPVDRLDSDAQRKAALLAEPAMLEEALCGAMGLDPAERSARLAPVLEACDEAVRATSPHGPQMLLAACASGWPHELRVAAAVPALPGKRHVSALLAGPFEPAELDAEVRPRLDAGCPLHVVPFAELELPPVELVQWLHVSQKGVRIRIGKPPVESFIDWSEIVEVFHARLDHVTERASLEREDRVGARGSRVTEYHTVKKEEVLTRPLLELTTSGPARRLRLDEPRAGMFDYLGRRKEVSHAYNLALVVKDLVRFGPKTRASAGVHCLFGERGGPGFHLRSAPELEHARAWFHALGGDAVSATWPSLAAAAGRPPARAR